MVCAQCGSTVLGTSRFCTSCGADLAAQASPVQQVRVTAPVGYPYPGAPARVHRTSPTAFVLAATGFLANGVGLAIYVFKNPFYLSDVWVKASDGFQAAGWILLGVAALVAISSRA
jgi:hypothetical protein